MSNPELTPHPQAEILRAIADGKTIEGRYLDSPWITLPKPFDPKGWEFRVKQETMTLAGHEFPVPVREPLEIGTEYWYADTDTPSNPPCYRWNGRGNDLIWMNKGLIHLTKEGAIAKAKAMIAACGGDV